MKTSTRELGHDFHERGNLGSRLTATESQPRGSPLRQPDTSRHSQMVTLPFADHVQQELALIYGDEIQLPVWL